MTYDIYLKGKTNGDQPGFKSFTFGYDRTIAVSGPYKLATQWLKRFLTTRGSDPCSPDDGTDFPTLIGSNMTNATDVRDVVLLAIQDCNAQIYKIQQQQVLPLDEQLATATLTDFQALDDDGFAVWVTIRNAKGTELVVPLPTVP
jgi:hypothetical protein